MSESDPDPVDLEAGETPFERISSALTAADAVFPNSFDSHVRRNMKLLSAELDAGEPGKCRATFLLKVVPEICNLLNNLHGGAVALAFDLCTSLTIYPLAREDFWDAAHVSRHLSCTYLRPAPAGAELLVECETVSLGRRLGLVKGRMSLKGTGKVCFTCEHDKALVEHRASNSDEGAKDKAKL